MIAIHVRIEAGETRKEFGNGIGESQMYAPDVAHACAHKQRICDTRDLRQRREAKTYQYRKRILEEKKLESNQARKARDSLGAGRQFFSNLCHVTKYVF